MKKVIVLILLACVFCSPGAPALSHNPFITKPDKQHEAPAPPVKSRFFVKIILWQHQLKTKMSEQIREIQTGRNFKALFFLLVLAFGYGAIHSAGPGHGKVVSSSYILSHNVSISGGLLFAFVFAFVHGLSGAVAVLGLRYVLQQGVADTLGDVTTVTQVVSFGLITLLGLIIFSKSTRDLIVSRRARPVHSHGHEPGKGLLAWAGTVGLVPCPAVVMVMLFCISMDGLILGLVLAACISLGMATTISVVAVSVILGKTGLMQTVLKKHSVTAEHVIRILSSLIIIAFGLIFLITGLC